MAIVIEEQKNRFGIVPVIFWLFIAGAVGAGIYYVFVKQPDLVEVAVPVNVADTQQLVNLGKTITPDIFNPPQFPLVQHITPRTPQTAGRANPFLGF